MLPTARAFLVEVRYREPSYEARHGAREAPYRFRYRLSAPTEEAAIASALREFEHVTSLSSVGWAREVVGVDVVPAIG